MIIYSKTEALKAKKLVKSPSKSQESDPERGTLSDDDAQVSGKDKGLFEDYIKKYAEKAGKYFWQIS